MASQAPSRSKNNNRSRNRNRGGRNRNNNNRGGGGGGGGRGRYYREKVPRAPKKKSFWEKILAFFGGGSDSKKKPQGRKPASAQSRANSKPKPKAKPANASPKKSKRTPEVVEVTSTRLYVGNLSYDASEEDLEELFRGVGTVQTAEVVSHRRTQRSKGYAFVIMNSVDEAKRAVDELHDKDFMGRKLVVSGAKSAGPREEDEAA